PDLCAPSPLSLAPCGDSGPLQPPAWGAHKGSSCSEGQPRPQGWPRAWPQAPCCRPASGQGLHTDATCPLQGIQYLTEHKLLSPDVQDIAQFLYKGEGLSKTAIGTYLGERDPTNLQVLQAFVDCHEFGAGSAGWGHGDRSHQGSGMKARSLRPRSAKSCPQPATRTTLLPTPLEPVCPGTVPDLPLTPCVTLGKSQKRNLSGPRFPHL
uniref:Cytohesin 4 n=1 Tax=Spermophilus dauricus TaxID=99837 RepID=A0A8C9QTJ5_SPEDA